jgi:hypothetical protein
MATKSQGQDTQADAEKKQEATNLAREAVDEIRHGNKEEGKFLAEEAKALDPRAAEHVLKGGTKTTQK